MSVSIGHRGPDGESYLATRPACVVFRRLAIVDRENGAQPVWNEHRTVWAVVNGEIYNHRALRARYLQRHILRTRCDVECVVHLYEELGDDVFRVLDGKFAVAIWDGPRQRLVLGRDPLGIKPVYYAQTNKGLVFGSELKALLVHPECPRQFSWMQFGDPGGIPTYVKGVHLLEGGRIATFHDATITTTTQYWNIRHYFAADPAPAFKDEDAYIVDYANSFEASVRKRLMADDMPIGAFLSGGIDSAAVVAVASAIRRESGQAPLHCFTILEKSTASAGDVEAAERLAELFGQELHLVIFDDETLCDDLAIGLDTIEYFVWLLDSPRFSLEFLLKHELHRYAKTIVPDLKVMLLGQGADEFAGGYSCIKGRTHYRDWTAYLDHSVKRSWVDSVASRASIPPKLRPFLSPSFCDRLIDLSGVPASWYHREMMRNVAQLQRVNLWHEDRTSASQGIEARIPFLDRRLIEQLAGIPVRHHPQLFWNKTIIRRMAARWLPDWMLERPKVPLFDVRARASVTRIYTNVATRVYPRFRQEYLQGGDSMFSADRLDGLHRRIADGVAEPSSSELLLDCVAAAVFERMVGDPAASLTVSRLTPPSPLRAVSSLAFSGWRSPVDGFTMRLRTAWRRFA